LNNWLKTPTLAALFWAVSFFTSYSVAAGLTAEGVKNSLTMNENLLMNSSLVRNVKEVNLPQVSGTLEKALSLHETAKEKLLNSDLEGAVKARDESLRLLMLASRLANKSNGMAEENAKKTYEKKLKSVQSLLDAHKRITESNSDSSTEKKLKLTVSPLLLESEEQAGQQHFKEALSSLTKAYFLIANSIKKQRSGQTLVRSLDFATAQEAYEYELGRYENYQMLVNMMIDERKAFKRDARTKPFFDEVARYQKQAYDLAKQGEYTEAADIIEKASKSLVSLLRDSGVHIPGV